MLKNYLKIAYRNLRKYKGFSAINIVGLAVGMTGCLLVLALIRDQDRRDEHHPHAERIYRVTSTSPVYGRQATSPGPVGPALERTASGVEEVVRIRRPEALNIIRQNEAFSLRGLHAEASFFTVFDFPLAAGSPVKALEAPYSVVLSHEMAQKVFGQADPLGQTVTVETNPRSGSSERVGVFTVSGVLEKLDRMEARSHLAADAYLSFSTLTSANTTETPNSWADNSHGGIFAPYFTYLRLADKATTADVETQLRRIIEPHSGKKFYADSLALQPLTGIHLTDLFGNMERSGVVPIGYFYMLGGLALLILLAAGFNYANLSVARSLKRAKEIGVRKTVGAVRGQVAGQFLGESVLMALLALPIAFLLLQVLVPFFNSLQVATVFQTQLALADFMRPPVLLLFVGFAVGVGLVAGAYPALHLSRFDPVRVLKRTGTGRENRSSWFSVRKGLTVLQLVMALCLIISAVLLYRQASYLVRTDFGSDFDVERLVHVNLQDAPPQAFKQQAMQLPDVESVSMTSMVPGLGAGGAGTGTLRRAVERSDSVRAYSYWVSADYVKNMGLQLAAGVEQPRTAFTDGSSAIITKEAVRELGFGSPAQAIGALITYGEDNLRVIGVTEAYTYTDPAGQSVPLILRHDPERFQYALVRARPGTTENIIADLRTLWKQFDAVHPLDYGTYEAFIERITAVMVEGVKVLGGAALLAVLIACLGLVGMAAYTVEVRMQEIGVRKVFGASAEDVVWLLSKRFLGLVAVAAAIALPLAYWVNSLWLQNFPDRIAIGWATPVLSAVALLLVALAAIGSQTVKAALANPADTLRHE